MIWNKGSKGLGGCGGAWVWKGANSIEKVRRCTVNFMGARVSPSWKNKITKQKPGKWTISSFGCGCRDAGTDCPEWLGFVTRMRPAEDSLCAPGVVTCGPWLATAMSKG
jgi:hypothetical protein